MISLAGCGSSEGVNEETASQTQATQNQEIVKDEEQTAATVTDDTTSETEDIRVNPGTDIDAYIEKAKVIFPFIDGGEQERTKKGNIEKRHFKFIYDSHINAPDTLYILLDVLFEENHYQKTTKKEIRNDILLTEGENLTVEIPTIDCIL